MLFTGITTSTLHNKFSVSHNATTGIPFCFASITAWESDLGSVTTNIFGSINLAYCGFVKVPGMNLPGIVFVPVTSPNFLTGDWPYCLVDTTRISSGSFLDNYLAATIILSLLLFTSKTWRPSALTL